MSKSSSCSSRQRRVWRFATCQPSSCTLFRTVYESRISSIISGTLQIVGSLQMTLDNLFSDDTSLVFAPFRFFGSTRSLDCSRSWDASDDSAGRLVDLDSAPVATAAPALAMLSCEPRTLSCGRGSRGTLAVKERNGSEKALVVDAANIGMELMHQQHVSRQSMACPSSGAGQRI
jgi:hypothetical protein